ncbi:MAG: hypothetical protein LBE48_00635 [Methanomassiliicoccaceae archaeon]|jgi:hypothetical protein|nr:hypothetical protein [Methanomassiliicoccaceae archaeon]
MKYNKYRAPLVSDRGQTTSSKKTALAVCAAVIAVAAVIVLATVTVGMNSGSQGSGNKDGTFSDPLIQGSYGLGTTFTYDVVDNKDENLITHAGYTAEIVGQSGSYYMLDVKRNDNVLSMGMDHELIMIHKQTGELRFSSDDGTETIFYEGKDISLKKWKYSGTNGMPYKSINISSDPEDVIPYKMHFTFEYITGDPLNIFNYDVHLVLSEDGIGLKDPKGYKPSHNLGRGAEYAYRVVIPHAEEETYNYITMTVAEGNNNMRFSMMWSKNGDQISVDYFMIPGDAKRIDGSSPAPGGYVRTFPKIISTIDGNVLCSVLVSEGSGTRMELYIGMTNGVTYLIKQEGDGIQAEIVLKRYISR